MGALEFDAQAQESEPLERSKLPKNNHDLSTRQRQAVPPHGTRKRFVDTSVQALAVKSAHKGRSEEPKRAKNRSN